MNATFYGPWTIKFARVRYIAGARITLAGTSHHDGVHLLTDGAPMPDITPTGQEWTITAGFGIYDNNGDIGDWYQETLRRRDRFDAELGLTAELGAGEWLGELSDILNDYLRLQCVNADPAINPPPLVPPYDFTYGQG